jgi:hypothetical protein
MKYLIIISPAFGEDVFKTNARDAVVYEILPRGAIRTRHKEAFSGGSYHTALWIKRLQEQFLDSDVRIEIGGQIVHDMNLSDSIVSPENAGISDKRLESK